MMVSVCCWQCSAVNAVLVREHCYQCVDVRVSACADLAYVDTLSAD